MIEEFLVFLRGEDMSSAGDFSYQDLLSLKSRCQISCLMKIK